MKTKEVKKTKAKALTSDSEKKVSKVIDKGPLRILDLIDRNPTIWELTWVFLWRIVVLGFCLYFFIGIFIFFVAVLINNVIQLSLM